MKRMVQFVSTIGILPDEREDVVLQKRYLVYQALLMSIGGLVWGFLAVIFDRIWQSSVPFGYVLLSILILTYFHRTKNFRVIKPIVAGISLLLPFLFQWFLGGFIASGAVMLWALLSLTTSVTYQSDRVVALWLVIFVILTIISGIYDARFAAWIKPEYGIGYSILFLVLNIVMISTIVFWLVNFLVRGKSDAMRRLQETQSQLVHSGRMATLGTLVAGVAHELNNPAAAAKRASKQLNELLTKAEDAREQLLALNLDEADKQLLISLTTQARERSERQEDIDTLSLSDSEAAVEQWLGDDIENAWELAPSLVGMGLTKERLNELSVSHRKESLHAILTRVAYVFPIHKLLREINEGARRISEIVVALKQYSFLGQAPVQETDLHEGLDNTLVILHSKLKHGITVHREYGKDVPKIMAFGSELNQVWTNILDNAIDAMKGQGTITIRTRNENSHVVVELEDDGPGIPPAIHSQVFDPFFTTKAPGKGTGLGLSTSYSIVTEKHKGTIAVESRPGCTKFVVRWRVRA